MINPNNILTVLSYDGTIYTNQTSPSSDPTLETFVAELSTIKYIYVGYNKPINALYLHTVGVQNTNAGTLKVEYYNGTTWVELSVVDQSQYLKRSGIVNWQTPTDSADVSVNGITRCWVRLSGDVVTSTVTFSYIGLVFSDDLDIGIEYPSVLKDCFYPQNHTDFMIYHVSAKNYIMAELSRRGYTKTINGNKEDINQWDVLDIYELRQASLYYAMSQIFFNLSDNSNDNYWQKYLEYKSKFDNAFNLGILRIDQDNDGQVDPDENVVMQSFRWIR